MKGGHYTKRADPVAEMKKGTLTVPGFICYGVSTGIRTPVAAVKGQCPRPLDDGDIIGLLVRPERFERPTLWFVARYSIQLSYGRTAKT